MEFSFSRLVFFLFLASLALLFTVSQSATIVVDGVSEWKNPIVQVGDSVIFEHKYHYKLYIFQNRRAFNLCNFTQATLLTTSNSTSYTWHPSRLGYFYFSFNNGSTTQCEEGEKVAIKVSMSQQISSAAPLPASAGPPVSSGGGTVSSSPSYPWPFRPRDSTTSSPSPAPTAEFPGGGGVPFINSNPAVPLPTGEVDTATIGPLPLTSSHAQHTIFQVTGQVEIAVCCLLLLVVL